MAAHKAHQPVREDAKLATGAVLTGHVDRLALFADLLQDVHEVAGTPGVAISGKFGGSQLLVLGTGMGGSVTARAAMWLIDYGCRVLVRAGGAGPVGDDVHAGDLVVASAAVRHEGASGGYLSKNEPAVGDPIVLKALLEAAAAEGAPVKVGVVHSKDSFYGEVDPTASPQAARLTTRWQAWRQLGVLASEMETAALFAVARTRGARAGAILRVNDVNADSGGASRAQSQLCLLAIQGTTRAAEMTDHG